MLKTTQPDPDGAGSGLAPWTVFTDDAAGNVLTETDRLGNAETYRYDDLHRLVEHEDAKAGLTQYAYVLPASLWS